MTKILHELAQEIGSLLQNKGLVLTTAESCTAGGLAYWVTSAESSSQWFQRGYITYCNSAKVDMLDVSPDTIKSEGAVSEKTAIEMAQGALKQSKANISVAITGIAGPGGGTDEKPVGSVWIAWAGDNIPPFAKLFHFKGDRHSVREQSIEEALAGIKGMLESRP